MGLYDKLNLNEVVELVRILTESRNISDFEKDLYIGDVVYCITKFDNTVVVSSSEGKRIQVSIYETERESKEHEKYNAHIVDIKYKLSENEELNLMGFVDYDYYESFKYLLKHNLHNSYILNYLNNNVKNAELSIDINKIKLNNCKTYNLEGNTIKGNNKVISYDDDKLLNLNGINVPNLDIINSFDLKKEEKKLNQFIDNNVIHPFTLELIEDTKKLLDSKQKFINEVKSYYENEINDVKKVKQIKNNITNGINNYFFKKDELSLIIDSLNSYLDINNTEKMYLKR